jgi:hypothetical protein
MTDDGFEKLEPANLIVLGDGTKQTKKFGGLLLDIVQDDQYKDKVRYLCVGRDGKEYEVAGNAALSRRIKRSHIGCLIKLTFTGKERGPQGTYKVIEVQAQPRSRTTDAQKERFPRWHDFEDRDESFASVEGDDGDTPTAKPDDHDALDI